MILSNLIENFPTSTVTKFLGYSWSPAEKDELKWKTIPRATAIKAYQKYFADFVIFGYSTDDVIPFINESDPNLGKINMVQLSIFGPGIWSQW